MRSAIFPPLDGQPVKQRVRRSLRLKTPVGEVRVQAWYGRRSSDSRWVFPLREHWGLGAFEALSPELRDQLAHIVALTGTYEEAAQLARRLGHPGDDSTLHALSQRLGEQCAAQLELSLEQPAEEAQPAVKSKAQSPQGLVTMMDGWMARFRGPGWGARESAAHAPRVEWQEVKLSVAYRLDHSHRGGEKRGWLSEKATACHRGGVLEFGRRAKHAARRRGLAGASPVLALGDGAPWIWNLVADQFAGAMECLDFYHASQHVWGFAKACWGEGEPKGEAWAKKEVHELRHGDAEGMIRRMGKLLKGRDLGAEAELEARRELAYFETNRGRMKYEEWSEKGWPIGSGAVESACRGQQCRFKRPGQSWSPEGFDRLAALRAARGNGIWNSVLFPNSQQR